MYRSLSVPVKATQFNKAGDHPQVYHFTDEYTLSGEYGGTSVDVGDWIVEFATGEIHVVKDKHFRTRFQETKSFTKKELETALRMAFEGDCV